MFAGLSLPTDAARAQSLPDVPPPEADADPVRLPQFKVNDTRGGAYIATEATSTTRVSLPIQDIAQTVTVVTRELIDDTQSLRMIDAARFATPILEGNQAAGDVYTIRGFRTLIRFIDGVSIGVLANSMWSDQTNIERLEIIKGPNAILVPGAGAGGIMNQITKSPKFEDFTRLSLRARSYLGSEVSLDTNHLLAGGKSAARLVATYWDGDGYFDGEFRRGWLFAPSFTHRFSNGNELVLKLETLENSESSGTGVGIDPAVGTRIGGYARKNPLLPRDNLFPSVNDTRDRQETRATAELRFKIAGDVASRIWVMADHVFFITPLLATASFDADGNGRYASAVDDQGAYHPLTGEWVPFTSFLYDPTTGSVDSRPTTPSTRTTFTRTDRLLTHQHYDELHAKNDYAIEYQLGEHATGTTIAGLSANWLMTVETDGWNVTEPALDYASGQPVETTSPPFSSTYTRDKLAEQRDIQAFLYQRCNLWDDRVILSAGVAEYYGVLTRRDHSTMPVTFLPETSNTVTDTTLGAIYKPVPEISLFAGYNQVGGALPSSTSAGEFTAGSFKVGHGNQWELGVKTAWVQNRITTSAAYFEITQNDVAVTNQAFFTSPLTEPPFDYYDFTNRGWEFEFCALISPSLEIVGNATHMHMRDANGQRQSGVPDNAGAVFAKYTIREGRGKGLGFSFGADYMDEVAGAPPSVKPTPFTAAGVPKQPTFYLAPRTIVQAGVSYRRERWGLTIVAQNLANKDYIRSSQNRNGMLPGEPGNYSATLDVRW